MSVLIACYIYGTQLWALKLQSNTVTAAHIFIHEVKREKFIQYPYREMLCKCDQIAITNSKMFTLWFSNTKLYCFQ